jgi:hypothetical protein
VGWNIPPHGSVTIPPGLILRVGANGIGKAGVGTYACGLNPNTIGVGQAKREAVPMRSPNKRLQLTASCVAPAAHRA